MDQTVIWASIVGLAGLVAAAATALLWKWNPKHRGEEETNLLGWMAQDAAECLKTLNEIREAQGLRPFILDERLARAASDHAFRMAFTKRMSNDIGGGVGHRVSSTGYAWSKLCQDIGRTNRGGQAMAMLWARASGNRPGIVSRDYTHAGVGCWKNYYCAIFAAPR